VGRGPHHYDKRSKLKEHDQKLDMQRALRRGA
jgi:tmRNA-binding protein